MLTQRDRAANQWEASAAARALEEKKFNGNRYAFHIDVEGVAAIPTYTEDIREIVVSGIPIYQTEDLEIVKQLLLEEGSDNE